MKSLFWGRQAKGLVAVVVVYSLGLPGFSYALEKALPKRDVQSMKELVVGAFNVRNLFEESDQIYSRKGPRFGLAADLMPTIDLLPTSGGSVPLKTLSQLQGMAKAIFENGYDILVLEEVENIRALEIFNEEFLDGAYKPYLIEGNDMRGIDVGFYVKTDLPFHIEARSHKSETWKDPLNGGKVAKLFSRDFPAMIFRLKKAGAPLFTLFGTHFKSKISRAGDPESRMLRGAQVQRASEIVKDYEQEFGSDMPLLVAGDFNGEIDREKEFVSLKKVAKLMDSLDLVKPALSDEERVTHTYHPKTGTIWSQLDAVMVNAAAKTMVEDAEVYRYKDSQGRPWPLPKTYMETTKNPSDHFPLRVELDFQEMLARVAN